MQLKADELEKIDVKDLKKNNLLIPGYNNCKISFRDNLTADLCIYAHPDFGRLDLSFLDATVQEEYRNSQINLETTPCTFGGFRYWLICPGTSKTACNNRVRILYKVGHEFACRECHRINYLSSRPPANIYEIAAKESRMRYKLESMRQSLKRNHYLGKPTKGLLRLDAFYQKYKEAVNNTDIALRNK